MTDPIRAALDKAACAICLCKGECFETRHGMMHGPCKKLTGEEAKMIAAFLRALTDGAVLTLLSKAPDPYYGWRDTLADAVLAAAKEERE